MKLIPVMMRRPSADFVSAPSKLIPSIEISEKEFKQHYAETKHSRLVSFAGNGVSNPTEMSAYGRQIPYIKESDIE
jgi:hypothetical protein